MVASSEKVRPTAAHYVEGYDMSERKSARCSQIIRVMALELEVLHESIDRRRASEDAEDDQRGCDVMSQHCTKVAADGSRTFTF